VRVSKRDFSCHSEDHFPRKQRSSPKMRHLSQSPFSRRHRFSSGLSPAVILIALRPPPSHDQSDIFATMRAFQMNQSFKVHPTMQPSQKSTVICYFLTCPLFEHCSIHLNGKRRHRCTPALKAVRTFAVSFSWAIHQRMQRAELLHFLHSRS
jgi:hypothetical protein